MTKLNLYIEDGKNGGLVLRKWTKPKANQAPDFAVFTNKSKVDCVVWFTKDATFGLHAIRLKPGKTRNLGFIRNSPITNTGCALFVNVNDVAQGIEPPSPEPPPDCEIPDFPGGGHQ